MVGGWLIAVFFRKIFIYVVLRFRPLVLGEFGKIRGAESTKEGRGEAKKIGGEVPNFR